MITKTKPFYRHSRLGLPGFGLALGRLGSLERGAAYLLASNVVLAGAGFGFWWLVARLFPPAEVGLATALIGLAGLVASLAQGGFNVALIRYLPRSSEPRRLLESVLALTALLALAGGVASAAALPLLVRPVSAAPAQPWLAAGLVVVIILAALNAVTDSVFIALRLPRAILIINSLAGTCKLMLPVLLAGRGFGAIFAAYGLVTALGVGLSLVGMRRFTGYWPRLRLRPAVLGPVTRFALASQAASTLSQLPLLVLPLVVLARLGAVAAACFYLAMMIVGFTSTVTQMVVQSLLAGGSQPTAAVKPLVRRAVGLVLVATMSLAALATLVGPWLLGLLGPEYAAGSELFLRIAVLSAVPVGLSLVANTWLRLHHGLGRLMMAETAYVVATALAVGWGLPHGLAGIAWALLCGQLAGLAAYAAACWWPWRTANVGTTPT